MGSSAPAQRFAEPPMAAPQPPLAALACYRLQSPAAGDVSASALPDYPQGIYSEDDFLLFAADPWTPSAAVLEEIAGLSDQRPELNCFLISLAPRSLTRGLHASVQLFQQLQTQRAWRQNNFAVILRAGLAKTAAPLETLQDVMLAGLLNSQSVWLVNAAEESEVTTENPALAYQQFMSEYEKVTRLSHFIPERNRYRQSYLRNGLMQLVQQELNHESQFSDNVRYALSYFADDFPAKGVMEKLMLKQPDIYFSLMKVRKSR